MCITTAMDSMIPWNHIWKMAICNVCQKSYVKMHMSADYIKLHRNINYINKRDQNYVTYGSLNLQKDTGSFGWETLYL